MKSVIIAKIRHFSNQLTSVLILLGMFACSESNIIQNGQNTVKVSTLPNNQPILVGNTSPQPNVDKTYSLLINRTNKRLQVFDHQGVEVWNSAIGIGKGGLKQKKNMADFITPTGEMTVDLILYKKPEYNKIADNNIKRFSKNTQFRNLVTDQQGLTQLFNNMNSLDFDGNASADKAYGDGYIGLTSTTTITGPKMSQFQGKPYWFSIALHGTPQPENIGKANSGGCVHIDSKTIQQLVENGWVKLGTKVKIVD